MLKSCIILCIKNNLESCLDAYTLSKISIESRFPQSDHYTQWGQVWKLLKSQRVKYMHKVFREASTLQTNQNMLILNGVLCSSIPYSWIIMFTKNIRFCLKISVFAISFYDLLVSEDLEATKIKWFIAKSSCCPPEPGGKNMLLRKIHTLDREQRQIKLAISRDVFS